MMPIWTARETIRLAMSIGHGNHAGRNLRRTVACAIRSCEKLCSALWLWMPLLLLSLLCFVLLCSAVICFDLLCFDLLCCALLHFALICFFASN